MWEKIRVIFTIPELRRKIFFTLLLLAVFRVGSHIPLPVFNHEKLATLFGTKAAGARRRHARLHVRLQRHQSGAGDHLRPGHHALHLGLDYLPAPGERLSAPGKAAKGGRDGAEEDQRIYPLRHRFSLPWPELGLRRLAVVAARNWSIPSSCDDAAIPAQRHAVVVDVRCRLDDDRRHDLPDVARRADRRVRHRQRHQPLDHGEHSGPAAQCHLRSRAAHHGWRRPGVGQRPRPDGRGNAPGADPALRRRDRRRGAHQPGPAADPHAKSPSTSAAAGSTAARGSTCRCASTRPASCRSSSPAACCCSR